MPLEGTNEPIFFVDAMLGNIAKKLRLMGYDSKYFSDIDDDELMQSSKKDKRIIISKDEDLIRKSKKDGIKSIFVKNTEEIEQLRDIIKKINLKIIEINGDRARCPNCNSRTIVIDKKNILQKIPSKVLEYNDRFWECKSCNQIFWEGTHIKNLQKFVGELSGK
jgi:uncharacterized protein with PIN domain